MTQLIRETAGRLFNHSRVSAGGRSGWREKGRFKGRRDAYSAIVWYWRGEGLPASISPNRQAPKALRARWPNRPPLRSRRLRHRAMPRRKRTRCPHHIGSSDLAEHGLVVAHLAELTAPGGGGDNGFVQGIPPATLTRRPRKSSSLRKGPISRHGLGLPA